MPSSPLDRVIEQVDCNDAPLEDAIDLLSRKTGVATRIHVQALGRAGVGLITPVSVHLTNVTLRRALDEIIASARIPTPLSFWKGDGLIEIGTSAEEDDELVTRLYDVRDILQVSAESPQVSARLPWSPATPLDDAQWSLALFVEKNVAVETWRDNGGRLGAMRCAFGMLVVTQTPRNQDAVEAALCSISNRQVVTPPAERVVPPDH
jgi:hypothetical protein